MDQVNITNEVFLNKGCLKHYTAARCAKEVAKTGNLDLLKYIVTERLTVQEETKSFWDSILLNAAKHYHEDILHYTIRKCKYVESTSHVPILIGASQGDHIVLIASVESYNDITYDIHESMVNGASVNGHLKILKYIENNHSYGICWNTVAFYAAKGGHLNVFKYAISKGLDEWEGFIYPAVKGGNLVIFDLVFDHILFAKRKSYLEQRKIDWNEVAIGSAFSGNMDIYTLALSRMEKSTVCWDLIARSAAKSGNVEVLKSVFLSCSICEFNIVAYGMNENMEVFNILFNYFLKTNAYCWLELYEEFKEKYGNKHILNLIKSKFLLDFREIVFTLSESVKSLELIANHFEDELTIDDWFDIYDHIKFTYSNDDMLLFIEERFLYDMFN